MSVLLKQEAEFETGHEIMVSRPFLLVPGVMEGGFEV